MSDMITASSDSRSKGSAGTSGSPSVKREVLRCVPERADVVAVELEAGPVERDRVEDPAVTAADLDRSPRTGERVDAGTAS